MAIKQPIVSLVEKMQQKCKQNNFQESNKTYYLLNSKLTANNLNCCISEIKNVLSMAVTSNDAVYFSTATGVYYLRSSSWTENEIKGINEPIAEILVDSNDNIYFTSLFKFPESRFSRQLQNNQNPSLIIKYGNSENYAYTLWENVFKFLFKEEIIVSAGLPLRGPGFVMNNQTGYFIIDIDIRGTNANQDRKLQLVVNRKDLYINGFIVRNGNEGTYYYLGDININVNNVTNIVNLRFGPNYSNLINDNANISWNSIVVSFNNLLNFNNTGQDIRPDLARVAFFSYLWIA